MTFEKIKQGLLWGLLAVGVLALAGCGSNGSAGDSNKLQVVATVYPAYDVAKVVGGDKVDVKVLVPPGAEPHDWEPTAGDLKSVGKAKVFIYNGAGLEPTEKLLAPDILKDAKPLELAKVVDLRYVDESEEHDGHGHSTPQSDAHAHEGDEHHVADPHIWLNPMNVAKEVDAVVAAFSEADPANKDYYEANGKAYKAKLEALDASYKAFADSLTNKNLVVTHEAFGYLADRYGFKQLGIMGISPDAEPTPEKMAQIVNFIRTNQVKAIFSEELVNQKLADAISKETGVAIFKLNPVEGLTEEQLKAGDTYLTIMEQNLATLKKALQ